MTGVAKIRCTRVAAAFWLAAVLPVSACSAAKENTVTVAVEDRIARAAESDLGWERGAASASAIAGVDGGCRFFDVRHRSQPPVALNRYAVLADETVVSPVEVDGAARILDACGASLSPGEWAEVVTGFRPGIGPLRVAHTAEDLPPALRRSGIAFMPPTLVAPDVVEFLAVPTLGRGDALRIRAQFDGAGIQVSRTPLAID